MIPGEYFLAEGTIHANEGLETTTVQVANTGDRPIQVGSHIHFFEANRMLMFPRRQAYGFRLNIPSGTSVRFEPGEVREVTLVAYGGRRVVYGFGGLVNGELEPNMSSALSLARQRGYKGA